MNADERRLNEITERIIGCAFAVPNELGVGFLEKVYENAMVVQMREAGLSVAQQQPVPVYYHGQLVGDYVADLIVEGCVIVELKVAKALDEIHTAQCLNYLHATGFKICLLINFGVSKVQVKRIVHNL